MNRRPLLILLLLLLPSLAWGEGITPFGATIAGPAASGSANTGNPLKIGGAFNTTQPTFTSGQVGDLQISARGELLVTAGVTGIAVTLPDYAAALTAGTAPSKAIVSGCQYNATAPAPTNGQTIGDQCDNAGSLFVNSQVRKATYSLATTGLNPVATATDILVISGSATKVLRLTQLSVCGTANSASTLDVLVVQRSTANAGGTSSSATLVPDDPSDSAATGSALIYTANPTTGSTIGNMRARKLNLGTTSGGAGCQMFDFGTRNAKGPVLRDVNHSIALNLNGQTIPAGTALDIDAEFTEE